MPKKPAAPPKPDPIVVYDDALPRLFLVYCVADATWRTRDGGNSESILNAGTFAESLAGELAADTDQVVPLERAVHDAVRSGNPLVLQAIAAMGSR